MEWHSVSASAAVKSLGGDAQKGLSAGEAEKRLREDGANLLKVGKAPNVFVKFLVQFKDFTVLTLLAAAAVSFFTALLEQSGDFADPIIILIIVTLNAVIGVIQESRAEKAIESLKKISAPTARVIRSGKEIKIPASQLVRGDLMLLSAGDGVAADARLLSSTELRAQESALTGESLPSVKTAEALFAPESAVADRKNMVFASSAITSGHGTAIVTQTGMDTQLGRVAHLLHREKTPPTPLQLRLEKVGRALGTGALGVCALIFLLGVFRRANLLDSFMLSVSLAVAAIPEGLPATVTIVLSVGVQKMARRGAVVRRLPAVEALGSATVICSDKTGTLTENKMTVTFVADAAGEAAAEKKREILRKAALCCNAALQKNADGFQALGEPTENAIVEAAAALGEEKTQLDKKFLRISERPFTSSAKMMSVCVKGENGVLHIAKGAPDVLLQKCLLESEMRAAVLRRVTAFSAAALRVLAVAEGESETSLRFLGLIAMRDPPRKEAAQAVSLCRNAGIRPVMITGDHLETAKAVAAETQILRLGDIALTGTGIDEMTDAELTAILPRVSVCARVSPEHKLRLVKLLRESGEVVAMTGDGVNDAPALKAADIGCAMGRSGTEVAKSASDIVLTDDNFATIVAAVREGRGIYDNIKKAVHFLLSSNIGEILLIFAAVVFGMPAPLLPIQLLWTNLVTDSLPAMALGVEKPDSDIMTRRPLSPKEGIFANGLWLDIMLEGMLVGALALVSFVLGNLFFGGLAVGRTMAFCTLSFSELVHAYNTRSRMPLLGKGILGNKKMNRAFIICTALQAAVVTIAPLNLVFKTVPLGFYQWLSVLLLSLAPLTVSEIAKRFTSGNTNAIISSRKKTSGFNLLQQKGSAKTNAKNQ